MEEAWDDFLLEAFSCQVWSFSVLLGHLGAHGWRLRLEAESWRLAAGGWRLRAGGLRLVAGGCVWRLEARERDGLVNRNALRVFLAVTWLTVYRQSQVVIQAFQSSQPTVLELWASPDLLRPPQTQLDISWSLLETKPPDHQNYKKVRVSRWASPAIIKLPCIFLAFLRQRTGGGIPTLSSSGL